MMSRISTPSVAASFKKGDTVPDWMVEVTPETSESKLDEFIFACDVVIVDAFGRYNIIAENMDIAPMSMSGCENLRVTAATIPIVVPTSIWKMSRSKK